MTNPSYRYVWGMVHGYFRGRNYPGDITLEDFQDPEWRSGGATPAMKSDLLGLLHQLYEKPPESRDHKGVCIVLQLRRYTLLQRDFRAYLKQRDPALSSHLEKQLASS